MECIELEIVTGDTWLVPGGQSSQQTHSSSVANLGGGADIPLCRAIKANVQSKRIPPATSLHICAGSFTGDGGGTGADRTLLRYFLALGVIGATFSSLSLWTRKRFGGLKVFHGVAQTTSNTTGLLVVTRMAEKLVHLHKRKHLNSNYIRKNTWNFVVIKVVTNS